MLLFFALIVDILRHLFFMPPRVTLMIRHAARFISIFCAPVIARYGARSAMLYERHGVMLLACALLSVYSAMITRGGALRHARCSKRAYAAMRDARHERLNIETVLMTCH